MALGNNIIALMGVRASKEVAPAAWSECGLEALL